MMRFKSRFLTHAVTKNFVNFKKDKKGNIALIFALSLVPSIGMIGAAVDYSQSSNIKAKMASAADTAAIAVAKQKAMNQSQKEKLAKDTFANAYTNFQTETIDGMVSYQEIDGAVQVSARAYNKNSLLSLLGINYTPVNVKARAMVGGSSDIEIALVLDNTGSMQNDMFALRNAARNFVSAVMSENGTTRMSVVPYVASVNVGASNIPMSMMDTQALSKWHGMSLREWVWGYIRDCAEARSGGGKGKGGGGDLGNPRSPDRKSSLDYKKYTFSYVLTELFGIGHAKADVTPDTHAGAPTVPITINSPPMQGGAKTFNIPQGFQTQMNPGNECGFFNPKLVSHFDLFKRIGPSGVPWKGCVEARPEPFDATEDVPSQSNHDTLFVPYFWPDEIDPTYFLPGAGYNNYLPDGTYQAGLWAASYIQSFVHLFKYNSQTLPSILTTSPNTLGPNAACPDELQRLTNNRQMVLDKVNSLNHWFGGGTIIAQGVMWGWHSLSPKAPFKDGKPYDPKNRKIMVLMSDGENSLQNSPGSNPSDYTSYGYLQSARLPFNFEQSEKFLDERTKLVCKNAKNAGIEIYTVLFRENSQKAKSLMQDCATTPQHAFYAANGSALNNAFLEISGKFGTLRLTK